MLFGPVTSVASYPGTRLVTSAINAKIARAGMLLLVNHMADRSSSRQDISAA